MAEPGDWSGFDTDAHRDAQAGCRHIIDCAVDAATRAAVSSNLDNARATGDTNATVILLAQLTGPCCLPPAAGTAAPQVPPAARATTAGSTRIGDDDDAAV